MYLQYIYELVPLINHETVVYYVPRTMNKHTVQFLHIKRNCLLIIAHGSLPWKSVEDANQSKSLSSLLDAECLPPVALSRMPQKPLPRASHNLAASYYSTSWSTFQFVADINSTACNIHLYTFCKCAVHVLGICLIVKFLPYMPYRHLQLLRCQEKACHRTSETYTLISKTSLVLLLILSIFMLVSPGM